MSEISYKITLEGTPINGDLLQQLQFVEVEEHTQLADMVRLRFSAAVKEGGSTWTVDDGAFPRLANIRIETSLGGIRFPLIDAFVVETNVNFSNFPGKSTFDVIAMDTTVFMSLEEKIRPWPNMSDSDIAESIFGEYGLSAVLDVTQTVWQDTETTTMQRATDYQFLRELAHRNGFDYYVELNKSGQSEGHFHARRLDGKSQGVLTVNMGPATNVNSFDAKFDMLQPVASTGHGLELNSLSVQSASTNSVSVKELGNTPTSSGDKPRQRILRNTGLMRTAELQILAQANTDKAAWAVSAEGDLNTVSFRNVLRAHRIVTVRGVGKGFSGDYFVERVLHVIKGDQYTQYFTLQRNAIGYTGRETFSDQGQLAS